MPNRDGFVVGTSKARYDSPPPSGTSTPGTTGRHVTGQYASSVRSTAVPPYSVSRVASVAWTTSPRPSRSSSRPRVWSSSASVSSTASSRTPRHRPEGWSAGKDPSCAATSGEALSRNHRRPSALTATDDWVRARAGRDPSRTARHGGQAQFHCGNPPPAAEPRIRTCIAIGGPPGRGRAPVARRPSVGSVPCLLVGVVQDAHVRGRLGGHPDLLEGGGFPHELVGLRD